MFQRREFALVLMDCQMPRMDGFEATAEIRALERRRPGTTPTPIVALSTGTVPAEREHCLAVGMQDVLGKPVIPAELECVLERWLPARCAGSLQTPREARSTAASDPTPDLTVLVAN
jgi:CheY-like chemotaxis protein